MLVLRFHFSWLLNKFKSSGPLGGPPLAEEAKAYSLGPSCLTGGAFRYDREEPPKRLLLQHEAAEPSRTRIACIDASKDLLAYV